MDDVAPLTNYLSEESEDEYDPNDMAIVREGGAADRMLALTNSRSEVNVLFRPEILMPKPLLAIAI